MSSLPPTQYLYNPHHHVKIWFSNKRKIFMNDENQMRLIDMRDKNPNDSINLIYDSSLLDEEALQDLNQFCIEYSIIPVDANEFGSLLKTEREKKLYYYYKDEINHLEEGGNLAVASDIVRWLSPVYTLGSYSDFDFPVDTSKLPSMILVNAPLLLNIGSLKIRRKEVILSNNDFIAVVDPQAAKQEIELIQDGFISVLKEYTNDFVEKTKEEFTAGSYLNRYLFSIMKNRTEAIYILRSKFAFPPGTPISSRMLRNYINQVMTDESMYLDFNCRVLNESHEFVIQRLRDDLRKQLGFFKWLFFRHEYNEINSMLALSDEELIPVLMRKERSLYLKSIVVCTTGPIAIANILFKNYVFSSSYFRKVVEPFSFNSYGLQMAFQSKNSIRIHENLLGMLYFLGAREGELNDSSWLEEGAKLQASRGSILSQRKIHYKTYLPIIFEDLKKEIEAHVNTITNQTDGLINFVGSKRKRAKINALLDILACFKEEPEKEFDVLELKKVLDRIYAKEKHVFAGLFYSRTKDLVETVEAYAHEALVYGLTKQYKIKMDERIDSRILFPKTDKVPVEVSNPLVNAPNSASLNFFPPRHEQNEPMLSLRSSPGISAN